MNQLISVGQCDHLHTWPMSPTSVILFWKQFCSPWNHQERKIWTMFKFLLFWHFSLMSLPKIQTCAGKWWVNLGENRPLSLGGYCTGSMFQSWLIGVSRGWKYVFTLHFLIYANLLFKFFLFYSPCCLAFQGHHRERCSILYVPFQGGEDMSVLIKHAPHELDFLTVVYYQLPPKQHVVRVTHVFLWPYILIPFPVS